MRHAGREYQLSRTAVARPARFVVATLALALAGGQVTAAPAPDRPAPHLALPALFGDHMVIQRNVPVPVWGTAAPGRDVTVSLDGRGVRTRADADGNWSVRLAPLPAGGPHELMVCGGDTLRFHDVLVGEVWLASGQSNMEMPVDGWGKVLNADAEVAAADHPQIRLFRVEHRVAYRPAREITSHGWEPCSRSSVREFSATAYFFARALQHEIGVPIGVIESAWGGTRVEAWTRPVALRRLPAMAADLAAVAARAARSDETTRQDYPRVLAQWRASIPTRDSGSIADPPWSARGLDTRKWRAMTLPCDWENAGMPDLDGVVWFRRTVEIPAGWAGRELELHLGRIDDADTTWFDGVAVGNDSVYDRPRVYRVPSRLVTPGPHTIAVRVFDWLGGGGLWGDAAMMKLTAGGRDSIPLDGPWSYRVAYDLAAWTPRPKDPDDPNQAGVLANGMIAPLVPYALRGVIWYQGEENAAHAFDYRTRFPLMIDDWRAAWRAPELPFLFVQLANFRDPRPEPGGSEWAELREAQAMALSRPHTAMAVAIDIGEANDIHPRNKQEVGRRLALAALRSVYGRPVLASGPSFRSMRIEGARVRLSFENADGGLVSSWSGAVRGFALAGADRVFHWADARIEGADVVVSSDAVPRPVAVRYGWADNPVCDLANTAGLPAVPFRTDDWPGLTRARP